jgi:hypothetical protein
MVAYPVHFSLVMLYLSLRIHYIQTAFISLFSLPVFNH